jgi:hypothetical protein
MTKRCRVRLCSAQSNRRQDLSTLCYLCGNPLGDVESDDHVVPSTLIQRSQPKVKGFEYAGKLPTHQKCNNHFGPEKYAAKALALLAALDDPNTFLERVLVRNPAIKVLAINADKLPTFTRKDLEFFKITDVRAKEEREWSTPEFFRDKKRTNPLRDATYVALSVLAKSAAALLIKRKGLAIPSSWRIFACPFTGSLSGLNLSGEALALDHGVHAVIKQASNGDWFVAFEAHKVVVFLLFAFVATSPEPITSLGLLDADWFVFESNAINDLLQKSWTKL